MSFLTNNTALSTFAHNKKLHSRMIVAGKVSEINNLQLSGPFTYDRSFKDEVCDRCLFSR